MIDHIRQAAIAYDLDLARARMQSGMPQRDVDAEFASLSDDQRSALLALASPVSAVSSTTSPPEGFPDANSR